MIPPSWHAYLEAEFSKPYFINLQSYLKKRSEEGAIIFPPADDIYQAFNLTPMNQVKVVILGQDPYHGQGQANGLCFSVRKGIKIPPSLRIIYKELEQDMGIAIPDHGDLTNWAKNGVLLLNTVLTVEQKSPGVHKNQGWETFTDAVIQTVSEQQDSVVFMLWGAFAHSKKKIIDETKHLVLESPHPAAELYAGGKAGFLGSKPFSKANDYLGEQIDWGL